MIRPADALHVQMALARMTRLRVSTRQLDEREVQFLIGFTWLLTLDEDQLDTLAGTIDSPALFQAAYDDLKYRCLSRPDFLRSA